MKKFFALYFLLIPFMLNAQSHFGTVKLGVFGPSATDVGIILGYEGGWRIDDNLYIGYSADWFNKNYTDQNYITQMNQFYGTINSSLTELRAKTNLHSIPLMGVIEGNWEAGPRLRVFFTGGLGLETLLIFYRSYDNPDNSNLKAAFDFCWRLGGGLIYELGRKSDIIVELAYDSSNPSWQYTVVDNGHQRVFERAFNMSGIMLRAGVRFYF